ncbi:MAG: sigma 54-interacting transcriptional regulator [Lysobacterales bacterium]
MKSRGCAVVEIGYEGQPSSRHLLRTGRYAVGSAEAADLQVRCSGVSRRHLQLDVLADGGVLVTDLESSNGTRLGRRRISQMAIVEPTRLRVGDATLTIHPDTDQVGVIDLPSDDWVPTATRAPNELSAATDMPQLGWAIIGGLDTSLTRLTQGQPQAAVVAEALGRWCRILGADGLRVRHRQAEHLLAAVGDHSEQNDSPAILPCGDWQLEISPGHVRLHPNVRLALTVGLAALTSREDSPVPTAVEASASVQLPAAVTSSAPEMLAVYELAERVAKGSISVLICGESGTGKELLAHWIHQQSPRQQGPFLAINCAALPAELLEAEIFGIERGVATGVDARAGLLERARGGTVFLDELGDMALPTQAKILRALESSSIYRVGGSRAIELDVRFVAATHRQLARRIDEGEFRLDLYHRLAAVELLLPPLRQRRVDIPVLAIHFLAEELAGLQRRSPGITDAALAQLCRHDWPGNVRELRNEMARAALLLQPHQALDCQHLSTRILSHTEAPADLSLQAALDRAEAEAFEIALAAAGADHGAAMALLKLSRSSYFRHLRHVRGATDSDPSTLDEHLQR